jgi:hypothetical protein
MDRVATAEARLWIDSLVGETPVGNAADRIAPTPAKNAMAGKIHDLLPGPRSAPKVIPSAMIPHASATNVAVISQP